MENSKRQGSKNKSKNALSLGKMIENTKENIDDAEMGMEFAFPEERENLKDKNARRRTAINQMEKQIKEEKAFQNRKDSFK
ncbi:spore protein Tlp [Solibacillus sp. FSL R7-0668]|uniref:spore protein Tlp n=1 Tax=Solibacillus sp. FSL R7-0668 TaxID=2921688 RepID=UPI002F43A737